MRISDGSSDVCSSDLVRRPTVAGGGGAHLGDDVGLAPFVAHRLAIRLYPRRGLHVAEALGEQCRNPLVQPIDTAADLGHRRARSEAHTSELQSLMRISYAVFCVKKKSHE